MLYQKELEGILKDQIRNCKDKLMNKLQQTSQKAYESAMKTFMHDTVQKLPEGLNDVLR